MVGTSPEPVSTIFDIPVLLDKNISYIASVFGKPVNENPEPTDIAIETGTADTWIKYFEKEEFAIAVTYNTSSGEVTEIFLSKGSYKDKFLGNSYLTKSELADLLKRGNISKTSGYYYRFYEVPPDRVEYTGVEVKKNPFIGFKGDKLCNGYPEC